MQIGRRAILAGIGGAAVSGRARAADATVRISTAAPPSDFLAKACEALKAQAEGAKAGLTVSVHAASSLFKQGTEVPALQRGTLEMSTMTTFEVAQQMPEFGFLNRAYLFRDHAPFPAGLSPPAG